MTTPAVRHSPQDLTHNMAAKSEIAGPGCRAHALNRATLLRADSGVSTAVRRGESRMRKQIPLAMLLAAAATLSACGQAVPDEKAAYVGAWRAQNFDLVLAKDGKVHYKRVKGSSTTS